MCHYQRMYIILRLPWKALSQPSLRSVCSILHYLSVCITAVSAGGERLGESFLLKTKGGAVLSKSDIYSLVTVDHVVTHSSQISGFKLLRH